MQDLVPRAAEALGGPLTCLVNNASIFEYDTVASATREKLGPPFIRGAISAPSVVPDPGLRPPKASAPARDETGEARGQSAAWST